MEGWGGGGAFFSLSRHTRHESEAAGQLHDSRGSAGRLEDGAVGADVACGRDGRHVVGDGVGVPAGHLHGGGGGGRGRLGAAAAAAAAATAATARQAGHREHGFECVLGARGEHH